MPQSQPTGALQKYLQRELRFGDLLRLDVHVTAARAFIHKLDHAAHLGEERVVLAAANVRSRLDARPALANDDCPAGHKLSAKRLHSQALRIRVASVS